MEDKLKYPEEKSVLSQLRFEEKHKEHVLNKIRVLPAGNPVYTETHKKKPLKKAAFSAVAATIVFALLIGSSYLSPSMAKVMARVPYFSLFIQQEEYKYALYDVIGEVVNEKKYQIQTVDASVPDRKLTVLVIGSKDDVNAVQDDIIKDFNSALVSNHFGEYSIEVKRSKVFIEQTAEDSPEVEQYIKDSQQLEKEIKAQLEKNNYELAFPLEVRINEKEKFIYTAIPKTETRIDELKDLLKSTSSKYGEFRLKVTRVDMNAREQELRWGKNNITLTIAHGLMENKDFHVTGFSYSFHPLPLQIMVKTELDAADAEDKKIIEEIEDEINTFIQTHELTKEVRNDPYEIKIYGKNKKQIN
jgi:hypothetical protein